MSDPALEIAEYIIADHEGCVSHAYEHSEGYWTIGYAMGGENTKAGKGIHTGRTWIGSPKSPREGIVRLTGRELVDQKRA